MNVDPAVMAKDVEDAGFESYWVSDHPVAPVECSSYSPVFPGGQVPGFMDPIVAMALAAKVTSHIKIGTCVLLMPERNTLLLAKQIATLDRYGGGRFIFGIGTGWNKEETAIMGGDTDRPWAQSLEACLVMKELWTKERAEFHGEFHDFPLLRCDPKPLQQPNPPILIGGYAKNVLPRVVKYGDGWLPHRFTPQALGEKICELHELARPPPTPSRWTSPCSSAKTRARTSAPPTSRPAPTASSSAPPPVPTRTPPAAKSSSTPRITRTT